jgi:hypothetical protein
MAQLWPLNPALTQLGEKKFQKYRRKVVRIAKAVLATNPEDVVAAFDTALPGMWIKKGAFGWYWLPYGVFFHRDPATGKTWDVHVVLDTNPLNHYLPTEFEQFESWRKEINQRNLRSR